MIGKSTLVTVTCALVLGLAGCEREGPAEQLGEDIDAAVGEAGETIEQAGEEVGAAVEQAGEEIEGE